MTPLVLAAAAYLAIGMVTCVVAWRWLWREMPEDMEDHPRTRVAVRLLVPCLLLWPGVLVLAALTPPRGEDA